MKTFTWRCHLRDQRRPGTDHVPIDELGTELCDLEEEMADVLTSWFDVATPIIEGHHLSYDLGSQIRDDFIDISMSVCNVKELEVQQGINAESGELNFIARCKDDEERTDV